MRRRAIEPEELFEVANRLQAEGKPVTATALLDALEGGSLRTIYKLLEVWQQKRPAVTPSTSDEIPGPVQMAFANAWRLATQEAAKEVTAAREKAAEEVSAATAKFQDALEVIGKLESESESDAQEIEALKKVVSELEDRLQKSENEKAGMKATAEQLSHQVRSQQSELERLHLALDKERDARKEEVARIQTSAEAGAQKAAQQIEKLNGQISEVEKRAQQLEKDNAESISKHGELERQLEVLKATASNDRQERDNAIKEAAELKGRLMSLSDQNEVLLAKLPAPTKGTI